MNFLIDLLFNLKYFVGFIKSGVFKSKLSDEEEEKLINELFDESKHDEARVNLIEHNLRLVAHIVKKYENTDESKEDLISIGTIGLIKAVDTYSLEKKVKLATYAAKCIENEILMSLRTNKRYSKDISYYDAIGVDKDGSEITLLDIVSTDEEDMGDAYEHKQQISALSRYLSVLDDREMQIITLRYGLFNQKEHTQREIAKMYKISRSYVSRIEKRALTKLLQEFKKNEKK